MTTSQILSTNDLRNRRTVIPPFLIVNIARFAKRLLVKTISFVINVDPDFPNSRRTIEIRHMGSVPFTIYMLLIHDLAFPLADDYGFDQKSSKSKRCEA